MSCSPHVVNDALARYCVECGEAILERASFDGAYDYSIEHDPGTLLAYLGMVAVVTGEGTLCCLNSKLEPLLSAPTNSGGTILWTAAADGRVYVGSAADVRSIDLLALQQKRSSGASSVLSASAALSPFTVYQDRVYSIIRANDVRLQGWRGSVGCCNVSLPDFNAEASVFAPIISDDFAYVATQGSRSIHMVDLKRSEVLRTHVAEGPVAFVAKQRGGVALLVDSKEKRRIALLSPKGITLEVPTLEASTSWMAAIPEKESYIWGDGSSISVQTSQGPKTPRIEGNAGPALIESGRAWTIAETSISSTAIMLDLASGQVLGVRRLGGLSFVNFAISDDRLIASNGHEIRSVRLP